MKLQVKITCLVLLALGLPLMAEGTDAMPSLQKIESIYQEENEPIIFIISATGIDNQTVWQLVGTTQDGNSVSISPVSVSVLKSGSWQLVFPGQAQGNYYVHATDTNGNQSVLTDALSVTEHSPVVIGATPGEVDSGKPFTLKLSGKYIQDADKIELVADADGKAVAGTWLHKKDQPDLAASFPVVAPGVYSVVVTSPNQKAARLPSTLKVFKPAPDLSRFTEQSSLRVAKISGGNWTDGMKAYIVKGDNRKEVTIFGQTADGFSIVYENGLEPGKYDLVLVNDEGKEARLKNALEVMSDSSYLPALWIGGGADICSVGGGSHYQPTLTVDWALVHRLGFSLGYEGGLSYLVLFPDNNNKGFFWFSQWIGYTFKQLNEVETMTIRIPVGLKFGDAVSYPYTGIFLDYELGKKWIAEIGYEYVLFPSDAPYSSAIHLSLLKQF